MHISVEPFLSNFGFNIHNNFKIYSSYKAENKFKIIDIKKEESHTISYPDDGSITQVTQNLVPLFTDCKEEKYSLADGFKKEYLKGEANEYRYLSGESSSKIQNYEDHQTNKSTKVLIINSDLQNIHPEHEGKIKSFDKQYTSDTVSTNGYVSNKKSYSGVSLLSNSTEPLIETKSKKASDQTNDIGENNNSNHIINDKSKVYPSQSDVESIPSKCSCCHSMICKNLPKSTSLSNRFICEKCGASFVSSSDLTKHKESECSTASLYSSPDCCKSFTSRQSISQRFVKTHIEEVRKFICALCDKSFTTKYRLRQHLDRIHYGKEELNLSVKCELCLKVYPSLLSLRNHVKRQHGEKRFECGHCSWKTCAKQILLQHIQRHHMTDGYKCTQCSENFRSPRLLLIHKSSQHKLTKQRNTTYLCELCGKEFRDKYRLKYHSNIHLNKKQFVCHECGKGFNSPTNLDQHLWSHSSVRPFTCDLCGKTFRIRNHLRQHLAVHGMVNTSWKGRRGKRGSTKDSITSEGDSLLE